MHPLHHFPLASFFALAYAWAWLCWWSAFAVSSGQVSWPVSPELLAILGQFGPFAAALVVTAIIGGRDGLRAFFGRFMRWRARPVWALVSLLLLPALMLTAILLYALTTGTASTLQFRDKWTTLPAHFVYTLLLAGPLGEEPGWRGFALPRLQARYGPVPACIFLGLLGAGWHFPLWWLNPPSTPYVVFVAAAILLTFLFTWLFNHTHGSVFYSLLFHASLNTAGVRLPEVPAYYAWVACLLAVVLAILYFDRRLGYAGDKPPTPTIVPIGPPATTNLHS
ncbi:MAG: CPBP family intramembrane glutamic endopeptidase [Pirellulales bacterium]